MSAQPISSDLIRLRDAPSRVTQLDLQAFARRDAHQIGVWSNNATSWLSRKEAERIAGISEARLPAAIAARSAEEAIDMIVARDPDIRNSRLSALAAVGMWRTLTAEQLAAVTGRPAIAAPRSLDRQLLWGSGLVDSGVYSVPQQPSLPDLALLRPQRDVSLFKSLSDQISYADWCGITGGKPWAWGSQGNDRHNVHATELALRAAEFTSVACVMGESMAGLDYLAQVVGADFTAGGQRAADALFFREDGMITAVEITSSFNSGTMEKIKRWIDLLAADKSGKLSVVFVECAPPSYDSPVLYQKLRKHMSKLGTGSVTSVMGKVPERLMLARWSDWFPAHGMLSRDFLSLEALRPVGPFKADRWQPVSILDPFASVWQGGDEEIENQILDQVRSLYGVPYWMRTPMQNFSPLIRERAGMQQTPRMPYSKHYTPARAHTVD